MDIAEKKPRLPYFLTLPVQYQRWLYQDYAYQWNKLTPTQKQSYATAGVRFHLTAYQYFMKYMLTNLPDIALMYYMDSVSGGVMLDRSRNGNDGTIFGTTLVDGVIDHAVYFDGVNDSIITPIAPSLTNFTAKTVELFIKPTAFEITTYYMYYGARFAPTGGDAFTQRANINEITIYCSNTLGVSIARTIPYTVGQWVHVAYTWDGTTFQAYKAGLPEGAPIAFAGTMSCAGTDLYLGRRDIFYWCEFTLDHFIIHNRCLDPTEILRHAERSWPIA